MNNQKFIWDVNDVNNYLKNLGNLKRRILPKNAYVTENFTWNELLQTGTRQIDMPKIEILENLKNTIKVLQVYRKELGKSIIITSSWRTPSEQNNLRQKGYRPSTTSLHLEGLALDFKVIGMLQKNIQDYLNERHFGEVEYDNNYTHISLPSFSKSYLLRHKIFSTKVYQKVSLNNLKLNSLETAFIIKRFKNDKNYSKVVNLFDYKKNIETFKNFV